MLPIASNSVYAVQLRILNAVTEEIYLENKFFIAD